MIKFTGLATSASFGLICWISIHLTQSNWLEWSTVNTTALSILIPVCMMMCAFWYWLPKVAQQYLSLFVALALTGYWLATVTVIKSTFELRHPLDHMQQNTKSIMRTAECVVNETRKGVAASRQAFVEDKHVSKMIQGIGVISHAFSAVGTSAKELHHLIGESLAWLDHRNISCETMASQPYLNCLKGCQEARARCVKFGAGYLCEITKIADAVCGMIKTLARGVCSQATQLALKNIDSYKASFEETVIQHTDMRINMKISFNGTTAVSDQFAIKWAEFVSHNNFNNLKNIVYFILNNWNIIALLILFAQPVYYSIRFRSIQFDNYYIDEDFTREVVEGLDCTEIQLLPLRPQEVKKFIVIKGFSSDYSLPIRPTTSQCLQIIWQVVSKITFFLVVIVLAVDWIFTYYLQKGNAYFATTFESLPGNLTSIHRNKQSEGLADIIDVLYDILDEMQQAANPSRLSKCFKNQPIDIYNPAPFLMAQLLLLFLTYARVMWKYLPAAVCSTHGRKRCRMRYYHLEKEILLNRS